jgi:hypothetical protein
MKKVGHESMKQIKKLRQREREKVKERVWVREEE